MSSVDGMRLRKNIPHLAGVRPQLANNEAAFQCSKISRFATNENRQRSACHLPSHPMREPGTFQSWQLATTVALKWGLIFRTSEVLTSFT